MKTARKSMVGTAETAPPPTASGGGSGSGRRSTRNSVTAVESPASPVRSSAAAPSSMIKVHVRIRPPLPYLGEAYDARTVWLVDSEHVVVRTGRVAVSQRQAVPTSRASSTGSRTPGHESPRPRSPRGTSRPPSPEVPRLQLGGFTNFMKSAVHSSVPSVTSARPAPSVRTAAGSTPRPATARIGGPRQLAGQPSVDGGTNGSCRTAVGAASPQAAIRSPRVASLSTPPVNRSKSTLRALHARSATQLLRPRSQSDVGSGGAAPDKGGGGGGVGEHHFAFEHIHHEGTSQDEVFEESVLDFVDSALTGQNVAILCYGPTGSGKTHTMMGPPASQGGRVHRGARRASHQSPESPRHSQRTPYQPSVTAPVVSLTATDLDTEEFNGTLGLLSYDSLERNFSSTYRSGRNGVSVEGRHVTGDEDGGGWGDGDEDNRSFDCMDETMGLLPRLVRVLLERRGQPVTIAHCGGDSQWQRPQDYFSPMEKDLSSSGGAGKANGATTTAVHHNGGESHASDSEPSSHEKSRPAAGSAPQKLTLVLHDIHLYGVELYLDETYDLMDAKKRAVGNLSDAGGLSALCVALENARTERIKREARGDGGSSTPRSASPRGHRSAAMGGGVSITSLKSLQYCYKMACKNRVTSAHGRNDTSSRSHAVFILRLAFDLFESAGEVTASGDSLQATAPRRIFSYVAMVDLAGSERVKETRVEGIALKEAQYINKSLSALSSVVLALYHNAPHIPFRDSKLTRLLRPCLEGGCVLTLVHVPPCNSASEEIVNTLKFAERIKKVKMQGHGVFGGDKGLLGAIHEAIGPQQEALEEAYRVSEYQFAQLCAETRIAAVFRMERSIESSDPPSTLSSPFVASGVARARQRASVVEQLTARYRERLLQCMEEEMKEKVRLIEVSRDRAIEREANRLAAEAAALVAAVGEEVRLNAQLREGASAPLGRDDLAATKMRLLSDEFTRCAKEKLVLSEGIVTLRQRFIVQREILAELERAIDDVALHEDQERSLGAIAPATRSIQEEQCNLAHAMASLVREVKCFELSHGIFEGFWAQAMWQQILVLFIRERQTMTRLFSSSEVLDLIFSFGGATISGAARGLLSGSATPSAVGSGAAEEEPPAGLRGARRPPRTAPAAGDYRIAAPLSLVMSTGEVLRPGITLRGCYDDEEMFQRMSLRKLVEEGLPLAIEFRSHVILGAQAGPRADGARTNGPFHAATSAAATAVAIRKNLRRTSKSARINGRLWISRTRNGRGEPCMSLDFVSCAAEAYPCSAVHAAATIHHGTAAAPKVCTFSIPLLEPQLQLGLFTFEDDKSTATHSIPPAPSKVGEDRATSAAAQSPFAALSIDGFPSMSSGLWSSMSGKPAGHASVVIDSRLPMLAKKLERGGTLLLPSMVTDINGGGQSIAVYLYPLQPPVDRVASSLGEVAELQDTFGLAASNSDKAGAGMGEDPGRSTTCGERPYEMAEFIVGALTAVLLPQQVENAAATSREEWLSPRGVAVGPPRLWGAEVDDSIGCLSTSGFQQQAAPYHIARYNHLPFFLRRHGAVETWSGSAAADGADAMALDDDRGFQCDGLDIESDVGLAATGSTSLILPTASLQVAFVWPLGNSALSSSDEQNIIAAIRWLLEDVDSDLGRQSRSSVVTELRNMESATAASRERLRRQLHDALETRAELFLRNSAWEAVHGCYVNDVRSDLRRLFLPPVPGRKRSQLSGSVSISTSYNPSEAGGTSPRRALLSARRRSGHDDAYDGEGNGNDTGPSTSMVECRLTLSECRECFAHVVPWPIWRWARMWAAVELAYRQDQQRRARLPRRRYSSGVYDGYTVASPLSSTPLGSPRAAALPHPDDIPSDAVEALEVEAAQLAMALSVPGIDVSAKPMSSGAGVNVEFLPVPCYLEDMLRVF